MTSSALRLVAVLCVIAVAPTFATDIPAAVLDGYLSIHAALAGDSLEGVRPSAEALAKAGQGMGPSGSALAEAAGKLAAASDIKAARAAFGDLSDAMRAMAGEGTGGTDVRLAYCPMVKKYWLQKGTEIANPYYGSAMLRCGEFKK